MITTDLFEKVLVNPVQNGANHLYVVSGYATAAMSFHHLDIVRHHGQVNIHLIVGMCPLDGLSISNQ